MVIIIIIIIFMLIIIRQTINHYMPSLTVIARMQWKCAFSVTLFMYMYIQNTHNSVKSNVGAWLCSSCSSACHVSAGISGICRPAGVDSELIVARQHPVWCAVWWRAISYCYWGVCTSTRPRYSASRRHDRDRWKCTSAVLATVMISFQDIIWISSYI